MATIFEFEISTEEFTLYKMLVQLPSVTIEIERVVTDDLGRITPYVWAPTDDFTDTIL